MQEPISAQLEKRHLYLIGKMVALTNPELAVNLIALYFPKSPQADFSLIPHYLKTFCILTDIEPNSMRSYCYDRNMIMQRRYFIAVMLHLYAPEIYLRPELNIRYGLMKELKDVLGLPEKGGNLKRMITEVVEWMRLYDDFKQNVYQILEKIQNAN